jgi:hypothetical protein
MFSERLKEVQLENNCHLHAVLESRAMAASDARRNWAGIGDFASPLFTPLPGNAVPLSKV